MRRLCRLFSASASVISVFLAEIRQLILRMKPNCQFIQLLAAGAVRLWSCTAAIATRHASVREHRSARTRRAPAAIRSAGLCRSVRAVSGSWRRSHRLELGAAMRSERAIVTGHQFIAYRYKRAEHTWLAVTAVIDSCVGSPAIQVISGIYAKDMRGLLWTLPPAFTAVTGVRIPLGTPMDSGA
jgi:hypothetical protein